MPEGEEIKIQSLVTLVERILADPREKVLVFTEFTDPLDLLCRVFAGSGWTEAEDDPLPKETGKGLFFRYEGRTPRKKREWIRQRFLDRPEVRILLATDAASESINLHKGCNNLVHLETVWNPNRYEQRNGRIDRYGQTEQPKIYLLINSRSIDERVAAVGYTKLEAIAADLGSVSNVLPLASRINIDAFLERFGEERVEDELTNRLEAAAREQLSEEAIEGTSDLVRGESFDSTGMAAVNAALSNSRAFVPDYPEVEQFLREFLRAEGGRIEAVPGEPDVYLVVPPPGLRSDLNVEMISRATFRRDVALREQEVEQSVRVEFLSPGHSLVRAALRRARGWVYQPGFSSRVAYRRIRSDGTPSYLFTFAERFLDGRGEAIEERFDVVFSLLSGVESPDAEADLRLFMDPGRGGNLTDQELAVMEVQFVPAFASACDRALLEATRRAQTRLAELRPRATVYGRRNRKEIKETAHAQFALYGLTDGLLHEALEAYACARAALDESDAARPDAEAHGLREEKEQRFRAAYQGSDAPAHRLRDVCDIWCAAWFWPEGDDIAPFTIEEFQDAADRILKGEHFDWDWVQRAREIAREQHFFHWELEFPEVFLRKNAGFDAMVGNPPWEGVTGEIGELADEYDALLRTLRGVDRDARVEQILSDPVHKAALFTAARNRGQYARFMREGPLFRTLVTGSVNTFVPFTAVCWKRHRIGGWLALILKDAFHLTEGVGPLRSEILRAGRIRLIAAADNERFVFDAHHLLRFDLLLAARGETSISVPFSLHRFRTAGEIVEHAYDTAELPLSLMEEADGTLSGPIPEPIDELWGPLFKRARVLITGLPALRWRRELHTTDDKCLWSRELRDASSPGSVLAMVNAFDALGPAPLGWLVPDWIKTPGLAKTQWGLWRVAVRKRANQKDERVFIGAIVPPHTATCDYLQVM